jgi:hypothetical protein
MSTASPTVRGWTGTSWMAEKTALYSRWIGDWLLSTFRA